MISCLFPFPLTSTINDGNEPFVTDVLEPELLNIHPESGIFYGLPWTRFKRVSSVLFYQCNVSILPI